MQNSFINPMLEREFAAMLEEHLRCCIPNLSQSDELILPMLLVKGVGADWQKEADAVPVEMRPTSVQDVGGMLLAGFETDDGQVDVDEAFEKAVTLLKAVTFGKALYSYSTQLGTKDGGRMNAMKTILINTDGVAQSFFSPYSREDGNVAFGQNILQKTVEDIFDGQSHN